MKASVLATTLLYLMAGCAIDGRESGDQAEGLDITRRESARDAQPSAAASLTWQLDSVESCFDSFLGPCTATSPAHQCPGVSARQSCSVDGAECTKVIGSSWAIFVCG